MRFVRINTRAMRRQDRVGGSSSGVGSGSGSSAARGSGAKPFSYGRRTGQGSATEEKTAEAKTTTRGPASSAGAARAHGYRNKPSARCDRRATSDPFAKESSARTAFAKAYAAGAIPCRINHGCSKHALQWDREPQELDYDPLLVHVCEGLAETKHPFVFVARTAFKELMCAAGGSVKAVPLTGRLARPLRMALCTRDDGVFKAALDAISLLAQAVGEELAPHLGVLLVQINKKSFQAKFKACILETLHVRLLSVVWVGGGGVPTRVDVVIGAFDPTRGTRPFSLCSTAVRTPRPPFPLVSSRSS